MEKFVIVEIGSTNTKAYLYKNNEVNELGYVTIEFKNNYKKNNCIIKNDKEKLYSFLNTIKEKNIYVFGTSIFRNLSKKEKIDWQKEFKDKTNLTFHIVSSKMENEYTLFGAISNTNYKGKIAVMIGGGGSTELSIIENNKIIESKNSNFGAIDITDKFPDIKTKYATTNFDFMVEETKKLVNKPNNKAEILILAGGNYIYFYEELHYPIKKNELTNNLLEPYILDIKTMNDLDKDFFYKTDLDEVCLRTNNDAWWRGARGMRLCVKALADLLDAKYIVPTKITMVYGIIEKIKSGEIS